MNKINEDKLKSISEHAKKIIHTNENESLEKVTMDNTEKVVLSENLKAFKDRAKEILEKSNDFDCEEKQSTILCESLNKYKKDLVAEKITDTDLNDIAYRLDKVKKDLMDIYNKNNQLFNDINEIINMVKGEANF